ncbi:epidermis-specific secreted glycoprotein EP1-like [Malania oleifera]|uniref:epidermis-specific secreted glycoprotein EP1-like n=1 Tax=Malania oleifera TaxID=397392 RepID=UPI0025AEBA0C|nr:epidermis-specific secreted glycoprotein EP1-like [Malania oleifera]
MTSFFLPFFLLTIFSIAAEASVPPCNTFIFLNGAESEPRTAEYDSDCSLLPLSNSPFHLSFCATASSDAFTLAPNPSSSAGSGKPAAATPSAAPPPSSSAPMATSSSPTPRATSPGTHRWGPNRPRRQHGALIYDSAGDYVRQSFDHPTDTLLVGQSLRVGGFGRVMGWDSDLDNSEGDCSLALKPKRLAVHHKSKTSPKPYKLLEWLNWGIWGLPDWGLELGFLTFSISLRSAPLLSADLLRTVHTRRPQLSCLSIGPVDHLSESTNPLWPL